MLVVILFFFFFQAEDGIRDLTVTGVQTCALPIYVLAADARAQLERRGVKVVAPEAVTAAIGHQTPGSPEEAAALVARGQLEGGALYLEIRRWDADMSPLHPRRILAAVEAHLIDAATGQV